MPEKDKAKWIEQFNQEVEALKPIADKLQSAGLQIETYFEWKEPGQKATIVVNNKYTVKHGLIPGMKWLCKHIQSRDKILEAQIKSALGDGVDFANYGHNDY